MKFNYRLRRLCGAYYGHQASTEVLTGGMDAQWSGSNVVYDSTGHLLISTFSNRIQVLDLKSQTVRTLPIQARASIRAITLSPDPHNTLLVVVDVTNHGLLINFRRGIVLHRFGFSKKVRDIQFSPNGQYIAVSQGKQVQVWITPNHTRKEFAPLVLHRTYTGQADDITCLLWSSDSSVLAAGSRDTTVRIWTLHTTRNYTPVTLSGHSSPIVSIFFTYVPSTMTRTSSSVHPDIDKCYSVSQDGSLVTWAYQRADDAAMATDGKLPHNDGGDSGSEAEEEEEDDPMEGTGDDAVEFFSGGGSSPSDLASKSRSPSSSGPENGTNQAKKLVHCKWTVEKRHYFDHGGAHVSAVSFCEQSQILGVGLTSGVFGLYEMPSVANIHSLSVGAKQLIKSCVLNQSGEWLALGCPASQQLLVWEWRSETYVLKQRGHAYGMRCMAYSPDGVVICTGGEDGKVKLWNSTSGFCYVTLDQSHTAPVTAVAFANASVVLSASLDGTVRAHDLYRYRTFKTFTSPTPVQFLSLAVDPSGEIVVAGSADPFHIYVWNMQTAKVLDVFTGHTGPVCAMSFPSSGGGTLATGSWDGTVKLWDLYQHKTSTETLTHNSDVVCLAFRPDGQEICAGTIRGLLSFWDVESSKLVHEIDGRRDIKGGRKANDAMAVQNNAAARYFTSVCYTADGSCIIAGGNSKFVCIYHVQQQILLKKFQVTFNRSLDGIHEEFNPKVMGDWGPSNVGSDDEDGAGYELNLPGAKRGDDGSRKSKVEVLTRQIAFSSTGREWSAVSGEGLHVYSLDDDLIFDPIALTEEITPSAVESKLQSREYGVALRMAMHLNEFSLVQEVLEMTPFASIAHIVRSIGVEHLERLMQFIGKIFATTPHIEFFLQWILELLQTHGMTMEKRGNRGLYMRAFRLLFQVVHTRHEELKKMGDENRYTLAVLEDHAQRVLVDAVKQPDDTTATGVVRATSTA